MKKRVPSVKGAQPHKKPRIGDAPGKVGRAQKAVGLPRMRKVAVRYKTGRGGVNYATEAR